MNGCGCETLCLSCCGAGGRMQRVRACPIIYGSCCCTGCWRTEWVPCTTCCGRGFVARRVCPHRERWPVFPTRPVLPFGRPSHGPSLDLKAVA